MPKTTNKPKTLTPFQAFQARQELAKRISQLQKQDKELREIIEASYKRANQISIKSEDGAFALVRTLTTVPPFQNPGYSYYKYTLQEIR